MTDDGEFFFKGPDFDFEFAVTDALIFNLYSYRILVFKTDQPQGHAEATKVLKEGLQKLVQRCPPLGGVVVSLNDKPGEQLGWKKAHPGSGIKLVVRDLSTQLNYSHLEARGFPSTAFKSNEVVPISSAPIMEGDAPGSVFQFTWIEGGALLSVGINHPIADGNGMNTIMGLLAEECRLAQSYNGAISKDETILGVDRKLVRSLESKAKNKPEDHLSYKFLSQPPLHDEEDHGEGPHIDQYMFQITSQKLIELKEASTGDIRISTHDAICALGWRSVMLARYSAGTIKDIDAEVEFHLPTDCRRFVGLDKGECNLFCRSHKL